MTTEGLAKTAVGNLLRFTQDKAAVEAKLSTLSGSQRDKAILGHRTKCDTVDLATALLALAVPLAVRASKPEGRGAGNPGLRLAVLRVMIPSAALAHVGITTIDHWKAFVTGVCPLGKVADGWGDLVSYAIDYVRKRLPRDVFGTSHCTVCMVRPGLALHITPASLVSVAISYLQTSLCQARKRCTVRQNRPCCLLVLITRVSLFRIHSVQQAAASSH